VLQSAANAGIFANAAQSSAARPNRKMKERNHPNISARIFMCVPPEQLSLSESSPKRALLSLARIFSRHATKRPATAQAAEKVIYFVIPSEARNLSWIETKEKRDFSARSAPRNDKN
jgi:hypothetical protein